MSDNGERDGQQLGNYRLTKLIGRGNFADVYRGQHIHLNTQAAIKVLHGQLTDNDLANFIHEARVIAHLRHPHIVRILDFGVEDSSPFLVMEYAPNGNLRQRHQQGTCLALETILPYVRQIADALQFAHDQKLIHRDIKPENMLLGRNNEVLLSDFGIAIMYSTMRSHSGPQQDTAGTIPYMAPEQLKAHALPASDQYALAIMTYEWLCGERPFNGTLHEIAIKHTLIPPPSLHERVTTISPTVEQVILKALAKNPQQRFEHIQDFALALEKASIAESSEHHTLPLKNAPASFSNLPAQLTSFIGREPEVMAVCTILQRPDVRLVTLTGTGGIGKTRLSLEVGAELLPAFREGIYFVPLASINDATLVIPAIAHTLGLQHRYAERQKPLVEHMEYLKTFLREKQCLLLLDNFEQVADAAPAIAELLADCPRLKILVTSRAALHISGDHEFPLPPLALPDGTPSLPIHELTQYAAISLFLQRAMAIKPDFNVSTGGRQNAPERHQTLRNTIAWSYHLLNAVEQQLFRRVSVFVGSCLLEAIEALYSSYPDRTMLVLDGVSSLIDKSLLRQIEQGDEPRIVMLETIREYALEMLDANGEGRF